MTLSPKENCIRTLDGEIPEYVPSFFDPYMMPVTDEMLTYWSSAENAYVLDESDFDLWISNGNGKELHAEFKTV